MGLTVAVLFQRLGPYHEARLHAASRLATVIGIELSPTDEVYQWEPLDSVRGFTRVSLFPGSECKHVSGHETYPRLLAALGPRRPHAVAIPGLSTGLALAALRWCLETRTPAVLMSESQFSDRSRVFWREAVKARIVRLFSAALVGGAPHASYVASLGLAHNRIFPGYDVVDNAYFAQGADAARANERLRLTLGLPEPFFLASSRFVEKKNLPGLLRAYGRYREAAGSGAWRLVLAGDGPLRRDLLSLMNRLRLNEHVLLSGFKQYPELPAFYGLAGAFIHASTTEQWGLVVNEAMAAGLPVIVSEPCGCVPDLVQNGRNGFTFDPYDIHALAGLMLKVSSMSEDERQAMSRASREIISRWTPETFAGNLAKALEAALAAPRPRPTACDRALLWALMHR